MAFRWPKLLTIAKHAIVVHVKQRVIAPNTFNHVHLLDEPDFRHLFYRIIVRLTCKCKRYLKKLTFNFSASRSGKCLQAVVLIDSFWRPSNVPSPEILFWYKSVKYQGIIFVGIPESWGFSETLFLISLALKEEQSSTPPNTGALQDGQQYVGYRVLFFCVDFNVEVLCFLKDQSVRVLWVHLVVLFIVASSFNRTAGSHIQLL